MLEILLGPEVSGGTLSGVSNNSNSPHILQIRRQALQVCNFVMGHLPENPVRMEGVHRAQNIFHLRALLLRSLQETGEWEDLVEGIEIGINTILTPPSSSAASVRPGKATFDDLLFQVYCLGKSICDNTDPGMSFRDGPLDNLDGASPAAAVRQEGFDLLRSPEASGWKTLQPTLLLLPEDVFQLPLMLWPSTHGSLPSIAVSTAPGNSGDDVRIEWMKASTNATTSRLLRAWAARVQDFLETQPSTGRDHTTSAPVPCSIFQATQSLVVLAEYLALALSPTAMSYNDLGIFLSSFGSQPGVSQSSRSSSLGENTGHNLSRVYFEAGLEVDPDNAHLLANLGSHWKKERNYEEAIRFVSPSLRLLRLTPRTPSTVVAFIVVAGTISWRWLKTRDSLLFGSFLNGL